MPAPERLRQQGCWLADRAAARLYLLSVLRAAAGRTPVYPGRQAARRLSALPLVAGGRGTRILSAVHENI